MTRHLHLAGLALLTISSGIARIAAADPLTVNFSNLPGSSITFVSTGDGATFSFPAQPGSDFSVTSTSNFTSGNLTGLLGDITGVYSYKTADIIDLGGGLLMAPVTPLSNIGNQFVIHDGSGFDFTADLTWNLIATLAPVGGLDLSATVNLTDFSYAGTDAPLQELAKAPSGSITTSFTFQPIALDLNGLATQCYGGGCSTSFSGTMSASPAIPEDQGLLSLLLSPMGIVVVELFRRRHWRLGTR